MSAALMDSPGAVTPPHVVDWVPVRKSLDAVGYARIPDLLSGDTCQHLREQYGQGHYRKTVEMARHGFGLGQYRYFAYPLPPLVQLLREVCYVNLQPLASEWNERLNLEQEYPEDYEQFLARCRASGAMLPTPLQLHYGVSGYNTLHQDIYGEVFFPFQLVVLLSAEGRDYEGGEFVLTEQRPRMQSAATVLRLAEGEGLIFTTRYRPVRGARGDYRVAMRHGISPVKWGERQALGIILHEAVS